MADKKPGGKSVGRVTIRVLPDTSDFKTALDKKLRVIEKQVHFTVNVDRAKVDRLKIKAAIEAQLAKMRDLVVDVKARVDVTEIYRTAEEVQADLEKQFEETELKLNLALDEVALEKFRRQMEQLQDQVERNTLRIKINADTFIAARRLAWLVRDRLVTIIPKLNEAALKKVGIQLLALSGARTSFNWTKDILDFAADLDKFLPKFGLIASSIGSLVSVLLSAVSSTLGLGQGLAALGPLFLLLPGMFLGTAVAVTAFAIAMAEASKELAPLADDMQELADIIQSGFWDEARDPIIHLVDTLMPQLREAFDAVSRSLGRFSARFAESFEKELAGGRLRELFQGIADSFDILATGTDAFAGAIVSLSAVAAKYSPRLATWFVKIANQFDTWLEAVANDGRLDQWIEEGIAALKDLGSIVKSTARIFKGLYTASTLAGSKGIADFADSMERAAQVVESPRFQSTLAAFFRGAEKGTQAIGDGLVRVGDMLYDLRYTWEYILGGLGEIFGGFIGDIADALNDPGVASGLRDLVDGLKSGFESFGDRLPDIREGIEGLLSFAGALAESLGPVLGAALAGLSTILTPILDWLRIEVLPVIGPPLKKAFDELAPSIAGAWDELEPILTGFVDLVGDDESGEVGLIEQAAREIKAFFDGFNADKAEEELNGISGILGSITRALTEINWAFLFDNFADPSGTRKLAEKGEYGGIVQGIAQAFRDAQNTMEAWEDDVLAPTWNEMWADLPAPDIKMDEAFNEEDAQKFWDDLAGWWNETIVPGWEGLTAALTPADLKLEEGFNEEEAQAVWDGFAGWWNETIVPGWDGFWTGFSQTVADGWNQSVTNWSNGWNQIVAAWNAVVVWYGEVKAGWDTFWTVTLPTALTNGWNQITTFFSELPGKLKQIGKDMIQGLIDGVTSMWNKAVQAVKDTGQKMLDGITKFIESGSPSRLFAREVGVPIGQGIIAGLEQAQPEIDAALQAAVSPTLNAFAAPLPDLATAGLGATYQANFNLNPDPGIPLADQVFQASQRLKARTLVRSPA